MMKQALFAVAYGLLVPVAALAQYSANPFAETTQIGNGPASVEQRVQRGQKLLEQYTAKHRNDATAGRKILDEIHANGIAKTAENARSVRSLLSSTVTNEEKVALARILGNFYSVDDSTRMNAIIVQDLRALAHSGENNIARTATLALSRLAYFPDLPEILLTAKNRGLIDADEYYGELAHITALSPVNDQANLVSIIKNGKSRYAIEILAFLSNDDRVMNKFYPETKALILPLLSENEPMFSIAIGEFDLIDAIRYTNWLHASARLSDKMTSMKYNDFVMARLNDENTDPRKIMGFLSSTEGKQFIKDVGQRRMFETLYQRISLYSRQLPQNTLMKDLVQDISVTLRALNE